MIDDDDDPRERQPLFFGPIEGVSEKTTFCNKVITTMVIRPLDDPTWCAQSVVTDLRPLGLGYVWCRGRARSTACRWVPISFLLTHMVYLLSFWSYLAGTKSVSVRPRYDDEYRFRTYRFIEQQKLEKSFDKSVDYVTLRKVTSLPGFFKESFVLERIRRFNVCNRSRKSTKWLGNANRDDTR